MIRSPKPQDKHPMPTLKPGYLTSEFWISFIASIIAVLAAGGIIGQTDAANLISQTTIIITAIQSIVAGVIAMVVIVTYIKSRLELKKTAMMTAAIAAKNAAPTAAEAK